MTVLNSHCQHVADTASRRPSRVPFALVPLVLGFIPPAVIFTISPAAGDDIGLSVVPLPAWVFVGVWLVIYPGMGLAAWHLWQQRARYAQTVDLCIPLAALVAGFLQTFTFWFSDSLRGIAGMDAAGVVLSATTVWIVSRYSQTAARWLLPWAVWMPITFAVKLAVLAGLT